MMTTRSINNKNNKKKEKEKTATAELDLIKEMISDAK